jgi:hypothetical protein
MNVERRPHGRRRAALVILVLGTLAVGGLWAGTAGESRLPVYPAPTFLADPGWRIEPPGEQAALAKLSEADAIAAATASGDLGDGTKLLSAQLVILTDEHYGSFDAAGVFHPTIDHRLVWLVRTTGTPVPCLGLPCGPDEPLASELNVVVDALTGDVLQVASWR